MTMTPIHAHGTQSHTHTRSPPRAKSVPWRNAAGALRALQEAERRLENGDREVLRALACSIIRTVPEMTLPLALELLRVNPSCGHLLSPPRRGTPERDRYLTDGDPAIFLEKAAAQFAQMEPKPGQCVEDWVHDLRGLATAICANERLAGELPRRAFDHLIRGVRRTVVEHERSQQKLLWGCFTTLAVEGAKCLTGETLLHVYREGRSFLANEEYFVGISPVLAARPDLWTADDILDDLAELATVDVLASALEHAPDSMFADLLHRLLQADAAVAVRAVVEANQRRRAGRCTRPDDWLQALQVENPNIRSEALSVLGHARGGGADAA